MPDASKDGRFSADYPTEKSKYPGATSKRLQEIAEAAGGAMVNFPGDFDTPVSRLPAEDVEHEGNVVEMAEARRRA